MSDAQERVAALRSESEALARVRAQIEIDQQRIIKAIVAGQAFAPYEFVACPRCLQSLDSVHHPESACRLCGQPDPDSTGDVALDGERQRLQSQATETDSLLARNESEMVAARGQLEYSRREIASIRQRIDEETREAVTPFIDRMSELSSRIGELRGHDEALLASLRALHELQRVEREVAEQRSLVESLAGRIRQEEADLEIGRRRVDDLSEMFDEILRSMRMPWYESAAIDAKTYLPVVNGGSLQELSSGGMKTLVNVAYYLANLTYALANQDSRLPPFMMIDSPRKNFGSGTADREHAGLIYERILSMQQVSQFGGALGRTFQLIVADNDVPERVARRLGARRIRRFSYEAPLIDDLHHPGPDVETIGR